MCGIAGFWTFASTDGGAMARQVRTMTDTIRYRGPDGDGHFVDDCAGIALGHRRLAIIDLTEHGRQPMTSADGRWVISYNGEIYNYRDIRAELAALGHRFTGDSDTEVLLEACARWGIEKALPKMAGMFAFALWDRQERRLFLARDRLGIKPLYWAQVGPQFLWASELSAISAVAGSGLTEDPDAVAGLFRFGYIPAPLTIWKEARKLAPGTLLTIAPDRQSKQQAFWQLSDAVTAGRHDPIREDIQAEDALDALLRQVVSEHMISDVPLGAFLSGGVDSSLVTSVMQAVSPRPVKTFSIGFGSGQYDEAPFARAVAQHLGTDHTELYVSEQQALDVVGQLGTMFDEPFADSSQIPTFLVSRMARAQVTVALSGDGGDEVFAGYSRYPRTLQLQQKMNRLTPLSGIVATLAGLSGTAAGATGKAAMARRLHRLGRYAGQRDAGLFYRDTVSHTLDAFWPGNPQAQARLTALWPNTAALFAPGQAVERMQYLDTLTYLPDDILTKVDRASMAVSLETRVPLLDHRVVELGWRMAPQIKFGPDGGKKVLRRVLARYVPPSLFERPKKGFSVPLQQWLRGPLRPWAEDLLQKDKLEAAGISRPDAIRRMWRAVQEGDGSFTDTCWIALSLLAWRESQSSRRAAA